MRVWRTRYSRLGNYSGRLTPNPVSMTPPTPAAVHHHPLLAGVAPAAQHQPSFFRIRNVSATDIRTMVCTDATGAVRCVYYSTWYQGQLDTYLPSYPTLSLPATSSLLGSSRRRKSLDYPQQHCFHSCSHHRYSDPKKSNFTALDIRYIREKIEMISRFLCSSRSNAQIVDEEFISFLVCFRERERETEKAPQKMIRCVGSDSQEIYICVEKKKNLVYCLKCEKKLPGSQQFCT